MGKWKTALMTGGVLAGLMAGQAPGAEAGGGPAAIPAPRVFTSEHSGTFNGQKLRYTATVAETILTNPAGQKTASVFTTSYIRTDVPKGSVRPVVFVFNGGPGSASLWLHMGFVGPKRVDFADPVHPPTTPPFHTVDNPDSPLDVADIVLIDPPGTGYSRILPDGKPEQFYGTAQDAQMTVDVIERWTREHDRWNAPKYLMSESYGTVRAAVVARLLAGGPMATGTMDGMTLNGIILLGQSMDMSGTAGDDVRVLTALPTLAATACYHHQGPAGCTAEGQVGAAKAFAADRYLKALYAGNTLPEAEREAVTAELSSLTGLSPAVIKANDLRISTGVFARELLQGQEIGAYDGRYTLPLAGSAEDPVADDPAMGQYVPGFVGAFNDYIRHDLGVTVAEPYEAISFRTVNARWDYGKASGAETNHAKDLATAMRRNPRLRVMVGAGYYDLVTTLGSAAYTIAHAGIPQDRTETHLYPSGHMPYMGNEARTALARDVRTFLSR
ncbi:S10 family peptidase [Nitrospirillum amazonense]|uniref:Carboxypeptidase C (Cathepsin A) n=1 Tax=Nitrospirillum amazonense TaxID=28077 RepID=A0A560JFC7_9PROT|nr:peptidase S10 [Nitrospirillum amazonense]MDG3439292.1 peptidase S10 [Nitrospirillum amazonense]TWB69913.1 carboxypeptidase C (cathepsin A) [Nitrospirillum amazonense]